MRSRSPARIVSIRDHYTMKNPFFHAQVQDGSLVRMSPDSPRKRSSLLYAPVAGAVAAGLLAVQFLPAQTPAPPVKVTSVEGITEYRLNNGLQVLLFPDNSK